MALNACFGNSFYANLVTRVAWIGKFVKHNPAPIFRNALAGAGVSNSQCHAYGVINIYPFGLSHCGFKREEIAARFLVGEK
jgi:hypothetical protein